MRIKLYFCFLFIVVSLHGWTQSASSVHVHFAFDKWELTASSKATLDSLTDSLDMADRIELHGHCDAIGENAYNDQLSAKRVQAVNKYLQSIGWQQQEIKVVQAHGENIPLNKNLSPEERSLNRRVEIKIISNQNKQVVRLKEKIADRNTTAGTNITLRNINFEGGRHKFLPESLPILEELLDAMTALPKLVIEVQGHICCQSTTTDAYDIDSRSNNLSWERARAVHDYLLRKGIDSKRVTYKGFAHIRPLFPFPEKNEDEMRANRRVEIKIISK